MPQLEKQGTVSLFADFHVQQRSRFGMAVALGGPRTQKKKKKRDGVLRSVNFNKLAQA